MPSSPSRSRFFYRFLQGLTWFTGLYLLIGYVLGYTLWWKHWAVGFWLLAMPCAMGFMAVLTVIWFLADVRKAWMPFLLVLAGWPFWQRTIGLHSSSGEAATGKILDVITFNVSSFRVDNFSETRSLTQTRALSRWLEAQKADVLCLQEYYNWRAPDLDPLFQSSAWLGEAGYSYAALADSSGRKPPFRTYYNGVAIFSRHPIVRTRSTSFASANGVNGLVVADIRKGTDTLRVISLHLMSMGVRVGRVMKATDSRSAKSETRNILHKLKEGFISHNLEMDPVIKAIRNSPYPVILCGDFNEVPTGLSYGRARRHLKNSFEEAGTGFGFTLNRSPWFIRIDNQFHSNHFTVVKHEVVRSVSASDHFPVRVRYRY